MTLLQDNFNNADNLNELLGSEVTGGELINEELQGGNILSYDASGDKVENSSPTGVNPTNNVTVMAWIRKTSPGNFDMIGGYTDAGSNGYRLWANSTTIRFSINAYDTKVASVSYTNDGQWHHVVGVNDGTNNYLYFDGELRSTTADTDAIAYSASPTLVTGSKTGWTDYGGNIADFRVYAEALSATTIYNLYSYGAQPSTTNLKVHWQLDEGTGSSATDSSGVGNTGTITGATWATGYKYNPQSRTTSNDLLSANSTINNFLYTTGKKPASNGRVQFSVDGSAYVNDLGESLDFGAYQFDGVDDKIEVADSTDFDVTSVTVSLWVKLRVANANLDSLFTRQTGVVGGNPYMIDLNTGGTIRSLVYTSSQSNLSTTKSLPVGKWALVTMTYDSSTGTHKIYIDGVEEASQSVITGSLVNVNTPLGIGARIDSSSVADRFLEGDISDVRVYSTALSASTIWDYYSRSTEPSSATLVGHWKFDGNANDSSGNGNNGTVTGATNSTEWNERPHLGYSLITDTESQVSSFDGVDDYVSIANDSSLQITGARTISAWFYSDDISQRTPIFVKGEYSGSPANYDYWFGFSTSGNNLYFRVSDGFSVIADINFARSGIIDEGKWYHLTAVWDGTTDVDGVKLYVNGVVQATATATGTTSQTSTDSAFIGGETSSGYYGKSKLSNIAIFNDALTAPEIQTLFLQGYVPTDHDHIVSYWALDGDYTDSVGSNDGTNNGATTVKDVNRPQPTTPSQQTIDISALGDSSVFNYRTFFKNSSVLGSYALDEETFDYDALSTFTPRIIWIS